MVRLILLPALRNLYGRHQASPIMTNVKNDPIFAVAEWILLHPDEPVSIPFLAQKFLLNEFKLKSDFKRIFGVPVITFQRKARIEKAKQLDGWICTHSIFF
jgi:AraC-like DNA-binding protein